MQRTMSTLLSSCPITPTNKCGPLPDSGPWNTCAPIQHHPHLHIRAVLPRLAPRPRHDLFQMGGLT